MKYFVGGGKINSTAIQRLYGNKQGKSIKGEVQSRIGLINNKSGKTVEQIAESLWMEYGDQFGMDSTDFISYVEDVISEFPGTKGMIEELLSFENKQEEDYYRQMYGDNFEGYDNSEIEDAESVLDYMTDEEIIQMANEIEAAEREMAGAIEEEVKAEEPKSIDRAINYLEDIEKKLTDFGKGTLGINIPVAVLRQAVSIAKKSLQAGKQLSEAITDAIDYVKSTNFYKNLSNTDKQQAESNIDDLLTGKKKFEDIVKKPEFGEKGETSIDEIFNKSKEALNKKKKGNAIVRALRFIRQKFLDRQAAAKRIIKGISGVDAKRAYNLLINKSGAKGLAAFRFKEAEEKIYKGLNKKELDALDKIIYARRIISVNENRKANGMNPYRGMGGYSEVNAQNDLDKIRSEIGDAVFDKLNSRADAYFDVFRENLDKLYESGRIVKETYENLRDLEYSPIKTLKYLISEDTDIGDIDKEASRLGVSKKDIMKLTDENENEIITDSRWLLMMNIETVESRAFENKMLREFAKAVENSTAEEKAALSEFMIIENPVIGSYKDGRPKRKYDDEKLPLGYRKINYYKNGVQQYIIVKESFANQLLDIKNKNKGFELIGKLTGGQILRFFATGGNPLFIIGNTAVDFQNILLFSDVYSKGLGKLKVLGGFH